MFHNQPSYSMNLSFCCVSLVTGWWWQACPLLACSMLWVTTATPSTYTTNALPDSGLLRCAGCSW
jgi:hypothetical protein